MGEIADMIIEGVLCAGCGAYSDDLTGEAPAYCEDCFEYGETEDLEDDY